MRQVSVGEAIMSGFRLIGREPLAFFVWALVYSVLGLGPQLLAVGMGFGAVTDAQAGASPETIAGALAPLQRMQPLTILSALVSVMVIYSAVTRAVLFPQERGFAFLRLDARTLWLLISFLAFVAVMAIGFFLLMIPLLVVVGVGAAVAGGASDATGGAIAIVVGLMAFVAAVWAFTRLSILLPMSFAQRRFRIQEAWRMTRGHVWPILGVFVALTALMLLIELLLMGVALGAVAAAVPLGDLTTALTTNPLGLFSKVNPAVWVLAVIAWALFAAWSRTLYSAAAAEIYRQLTGPDTAEVFA